MKGLIVCLILFVFVQMFCSAEDSSVMFNLRPDVPDKVSVEMWDVTCSFEYAANGGSSEEWILELAENSIGEIVCTIARPHPPSYLYFNSFTISITGGEIENAEIEGNAGTLSIESDFTITGSQLTSHYNGEINLFEVYIIED